MEGNKEGEIGKIEDTLSEGDGAVPSDRAGAVSSSVSTSRAEAFNERGGIVTARGTVDGLVIRLDGRVSKENLKSAVVEFLKTRRGFVAGNEVALEWVGSVPEQDFVTEISALLNAEFAISVRSSELWKPVVREAASSSNREEISEKVDEIPVRRSRARESADRALAGLTQSHGGLTPSLFDGIEGIQVEEQRSRPVARSAPRSSSVGALGSVMERGVSRASSGNLAVDAAAWDDPDARLIYGTLRSGQKIETEHSLIIFGDVNSGAELVAGGDIFVLGNLRGIAHAGAYDETGGGRVIFALNLQPTQLRIGMTISRGSTDSSSRGAEASYFPEIARVEGNLIVVEPFSTRPVLSRQGVGKRR